MKSSISSTATSPHRRSCRGHRCSRHLSTAPAAQPRKLALPRTSLTGWWTIHTAHTRTCAAAACSQLRSGQHRRLQQRCFRHSRRGSTEVQTAGVGVVVCSLGDIVRRKHEQVGRMLDELGPDGVDERLQSATASPLNPGYRLSQLIADKVPHEGRPLLIFELPTDSDEDISALAKRYEAAGADALAVRTDGGTGAATKLAPLFAACRAVRVPVLQTDWFLHPIQVVEAKSAGAAGVLGIVASVSGQGTPIMSGFAASLGLDAPVEVINAQEVAALEPAGVPFFGVNLSISLAVSKTAPTIAADIARGLIGNMPFATLTMAGVRSVGAARNAREAGADSLLVLPELVAGYPAGTDLAQIVAELKYATSGDD